jgi:hypothetical protein
MSSPAVAIVVYEIGTTYPSEALGFNLKFFMGSVLLMFLAFLFLVPNVSCVTAFFFLECHAVFTDIFCSSLNI